MSTTPPYALNIDTPLPGRLSVISGNDNGCPDRKTLYIKVAQSGSLNTNTIHIPSPHPSNIPIIELPPPLRTVCPMICPLLQKYPDEFISNTKVVRDSSTKPDTPPLRLSYVHDTSGMTPPPGTSSGNQPEPVLHPQMNSCSVQRVSYNVRAPLTFKLSCNSFD